MQFFIFWSNYIRNVFSCFTRRYFQLFFDTWRVVQVFVGSKCHFHTGSFISFLDLLCRWPQITTALFLHRLYCALNLHLNAPLNLALSFKIVFFLTFSRNTRKENTSFMPLFCLIILNQVFYGFVRINWQHFTVPAQQFRPGDKFLVYTIIAILPIE